MPKINALRFLKTNLGTDLNKILTRFYKIPKSFLEKGLALKTFFEYGNVVYLKGSENEFTKSSWTVLCRHNVDAEFFRSKSSSIISKEFLHFFNKDVVKIFKEEIVILKDLSDGTYQIFYAEDYELYEELLCENYSLVSRKEILESLFSIQVAELFENASLTIKKHFETLTAKHLVNLM